MDDIVVRADKIRRQYKDKETGSKSPAPKSILTKKIKAK